MFDRIYTAYGTVEKFSALTTASTAPKTFEDQIKEATVLHNSKADERMKLININTTGIILDKTFTDNCNIDACYLDKKTCVGMSDVDRNNPDKTLKNSGAQCTMTCGVRNNNTPNAMGCECSNIPNSGNPPKKKCWEGTDVKVKFASDKSPIIYYDKQNEAIQRNRLESNTDRNEAFTQQDDEVNEVLPFFDQRVFRPSWASVGNEKYLNKNI